MKWPWTPRLKRMYIPEPIDWAPERTDNICKHLTSCDALSINTTFTKSQAERIINRAKHLINQVSAQAEKGE